MTLTVTDNHGAVSQSTANVTVLDKVPPTITVPANIVVNTDPGQCTAKVVFKVNATDDCSAAMVTTDIASGTAFAKGTTRVKATATDASGNAVSKTFTVTVNDTEKPAIASPADLVIVSDRKACAVGDHDDHDWEHHGKNGRHRAEGEDHSRCSAE